jgi:hypothetical protein
MSGPTEMMKKGEKPMQGKKDNRVLGRRLARDLTPDELLERLASRRASAYLK